jgi:perosamine synthetase
MRTSSAITLTSADVAIPWYEPLFDAADIEAVRATMAGGFINEGKANRAFEKELTSYFGIAHAVTAPSGTLALALALMAVGVRRGHTVLVPDITFIGSAGAVRLAGAEPVLVDVDPRTFNMDPEDAARRVRPDTKAIMAVHLNGRPADLAPLRALASQHGLALIEDAAEAIGSRSAEGWLGTLSDAGCFSLAPTKIITSGQGGFVLTPRQDLRDEVVRLKDHGRLSRASDEHDVTGFNFKVTDLQGSLALSQWKKLPGRIERALAIDARYRAGLAGVGDLAFPARPDHGAYLMWPDFTSGRRDELVDALRRQGIVLRPFWPALHTQKAYAAADTYPGARQASATACWMPCSPGITDLQLDTVIRAIRDFFGA